VSSEVFVPTSIRSEVASWGLPIGLEGELYGQLADDLKDGTDSCWRIGGHWPMFVHVIELPDPVTPGIVHHCTFWLISGMDANQLIVRQAKYQPLSVWDDDSDDPPLTDPPRNG
jgi:hypothetical protein